MRIQRQAWRTGRSRLLLLLVAGVVLGTLGGFQIARMIERAGMSGLFGGPVAAPAEYRPEKPTEEDRSMGLALAAAMAADELADCRSLAPRHRAGCRDYVEDRRRRGPIAGDEPALPAAPSSNSASAPDDWPARLD
jgi:hypothetical protein